MTSDLSALRSTLAVFSTKLVQRLSNIIFDAFALLEVGFLVGGLSGCGWVILGSRMAAGAETFLLPQLLTQNSKKTVGISLDNLIKKNIEKIIILTKV